MNSRRILLLAPVATALAFPAYSQCDRGKLFASDPGGGDRFGGDVTVQGAILMVGARGADGVEGAANAGAAYVFELVGSSWQQTQKLVVSEATHGQHCFGGHVFLHDEIAFIANPCDRDPLGGIVHGSLYVFEKGPGGWERVARLVHSTTSEDGFASDLWAFGSVLIVGADLADGPQTDSGAAYVFESTESGWVERQELLASDGETDDRFGGAVALEGSWAIVGALGEDGLDIAIGAAYMFEFDGTGWVERQKLRASDAGRTNRFGTAVTIDGNRVLIGADGATGVVTDSGAAYVFQYDGTDWVETAKLFASDGMSSDDFGHRVALQGDRAFVSAPHAAGAAGIRAGAVYVFEYDGSQWSEVAKLTGMDGELGDEYGFGLAVDGTTVVVGADEVSDAATDAGAVYVLSYPTAGTPYCFGTGCPCGNDDPDAGCASSTGAGALLEGCGSTSVTDDDLVLSVTGMPPNQSGIVYMGAGQLALPFGDGLRCVGAGGAGIFRYFPVQSSGARGAIVLGPAIVAHSLARFPSAGQIGPGDTWNFQGWHRDPGGPCGFAFNLSNAVAVTFSP